MISRLTGRSCARRWSSLAAATTAPLATTTQCIGSRQKLFMFDDSAPGQAFLLPHGPARTTGRRRPATDRRRSGTRVFNRLVEMMRALYRIHDYDELVTPLMFRQELWKTSGHHDHYENEMFGVTRRSRHADTGAGTTARGNARADRSNVLIAYLQMAVGA